MVELIDTGSHDNWDAHGDMQQHRGKGSASIARSAALIEDLNSAGCWNRSGRRPPSSAVRPGPPSPRKKGANHHAAAFSCFLAGAGVRGGMTYGETDPYGPRSSRIRSTCTTITPRSCTCGLDHTRLTYRYAGRDFRLTDVAGNVLHPILA